MDSIFKENETEMLELELIQSFRKLKIVDMPKFSPTLPNNSKSSKKNPPPMKNDKNIFQTNDNIGSNFFSSGFSINSSPNNIRQKISRIIQYPQENREFDDERFYNGEEEDKEYGELNEKNDYPEGEENEIYYGQKYEDPEINPMIDDLENEEEEFVSEEIEKKMRENEEEDSHEEEVAYKYKPYKRFHTIYDKDYEQTENYDSDDQINFMSDDF